MEHIGWRSHAFDWGAPIFILAGWLTYLLAGAPPGATALMLVGSLAIYAVFYSGKQVISLYVFMGVVSLYILGALSAGSLSKMFFGNDAELTTIAGVFAVGVAFFSGMRMTKAIQKPAVAPLSVLCLALLFLVAVPSLSRVAGIPSLFTGSYAPSLSVSYDLALRSLATYPTQAFFGFGPGSFEQVWDEYRPLEVNISPLWDVQVTKAASASVQFLVEYGLIGATLVLFCFYLLIEHSVHRYRKQTPKN